MLSYYFKSETFISVIISNFDEVVDFTEIKPCQKLAPYKKAPPPARRCIIKYTKSLISIVYCKVCVDSVYKLASNIFLHVLAAAAQVC